MWPFKKKPEADPNAWVALVQLEHHLIQFMQSVSKRERYEVVVFHHASALSSCDRDAPIRIVVSMEPLEFKFFVAQYQEDPKWPGVQITNLPSLGGFDNFDDPFSMGAAAVITPLDR